MTDSIHQTPMSNDVNELDVAIVEAQVKEEPLLEQAEGSDPSSGLKPPDASALCDTKARDATPEMAEGTVSDHIPNDDLENVEAEGDVKEGAEGDAFFDEDGLVWDYYENDVLSGRGAWVNAHRGNQKFRAYCFARKPEFDVGNHAAKRRIATEIVDIVKGNEGRFLRRKDQKGPWYEMNYEQSVMKACQVMRDHKRPDRVAIREAALQTGNQRRRIRSTESTPMGDIPVVPTPAEPIVENPFGVHSNDVLSGRGAFVNGHVGNQKFREWAVERKERFDAGNFAEKRTLATEIVRMVRNLNPPGRFLKRIDPKKPPKTPIESPPGLEGHWEELNDEQAIHKACQVMRDIDRPDRKDRGVRKKRKLEDASKRHDETQKAAEASSSSLDGATQEIPVVDGPDLSVVETAPLVDESSSSIPVDLLEANDVAPDTKESVGSLTDNAAESSTIEEAMAATEEALNKALDSVPVKLDETVARI